MNTLSGQQSANQQSAGMASQPRSLHALCIEQLTNPYSLDILTKILAASHRETQLYKSTEKLIVTIIDEFQITLDKALAENKKNGEF